ncbi:ATP-binding cassette domain-containing protein [Nocardiopsis composta]
MIEIRDLTKSFGRTAALDRLSFTAEPGRVTGFLGPNGAGKSTTLRLLLGLDRPDSGSALVFGGRYAGLRYPLRRVGSLIDADAVDGARRAGDHLRWLARSNRIGAHRVTEVLDLVGLGVAAAARSATVSIALLAALWYVVPMTTRFLPEPWGSGPGRCSPAAWPTRSPPPAAAASTATSSPRPGRPRRWRPGRCSRCSPPCRPSAGECETAAPGTAPAPAPISRAGGSAGRRFG